MNELQHELDVETTLIAEPLEELMAFAANTCLREPALYDQKLNELKKAAETDEKTNIARRVGLWPLREAVQLALNTTLKEKDEVLENIASEVLHTKIDSETQLKIEAFGQAILEEAFLCLGKEAVQKVADWHAAETADEKKKISNWVLQVVYQMIGIELDEDGRMVNSVDSDDELEDNVAESVETTPEREDQVLWYHPVRLSPKYIGEYPNTRVEPACLGMSILVSSFYEKLGTPYLHAGVVRTALDEVRVDSYLIAKTIEKYVNDHSLDMHNELRELLTGISEDANEILRSDIGFHAAVFAQLAEQDWTQTDPHYKRNTRLWEWTSAELDEIFRTLSDLGKQVKGTEVLWQNRNSLSLHSLWNFAQELAEKPPRDDAEIEAFLLNAPLSTKTQELVEEFLGDFLEGSELKGYEELRQVMSDLCEQTYETEYKFWVEEYLLPRAIHKRVFPDSRRGDLSKSLARCKTDSRYLKDRIEDIKLLPFYAVLALQLDLANRVIRGSFNKAHSTLELGLPAYKVGMSVLSHLAVWCGDKLPPSFWLTYWPSQVSFAEHVTAQPSSRAQQQIAYQIARFIDREMWTYLNINGIVEPILDQGGAPVEGENQAASARGADEPSRN